MADNQISIKGVMLIDIGVGDLFSLELVDDAIVARMVKSSVVYH